MIADAATGGLHAQRRLHGWPERDQLVDAPDACRLAIAGTLTLPHAPRDALDSGQHCRPLPDEARRLPHQAPARRRHGNVRRGQVRGDHGAVRRRVCVHDREGVHKRRDPQRRAHRVADARLQGQPVLLALQLDAQDLEGGRLRHPDSDAEQVLDRGDAPRLPLPPRQAEYGRGDWHVHG